MITLIHGEDQESSRIFYTSLKKRSKNPISLETGNLDKNTLVQILEGSSLFEKEKDIFIEHFFTVRRTNSNEFKELLNYLASHTKDVNIYFWEGKEIQKSALSVLKNAEIKSFSLPKPLFPFLESIRPGNYGQMISLFHQTLRSSEIEILFFMLVRQFRLMLSITNDAHNSIEEVKRLASWQKGKLERQAGLFAPDSLKKHYEELFQIELSQKTGGSPASFPQAVDFFLLSL